MKKEKREEDFKLWLKKAAAQALADSRIKQGDLKSYARGALKVFKKRSV